MNIPIDKQAHFLVGAVIAIVVGLAILLLRLAVTGEITLPGAAVAMLAGFASGAVVNWWKDYIHDKAHPETNTFDPRDFHAGAAGAFAGALVVGAVVAGVWAVCLVWC